MDQQLVTSEGNKSFWHNPFVVIVSAMLLFFTAQLMGAFLTPRIGNENIQLTLFIAVNTITLFAFISIAKRVIGFKWRALGFKRPRFFYLLVSFPAFFGYLALSLSLTYLAQRFIPGFDVQQAQDIGFNNTRTGLELAAAFLSLVVLTPIFEETIFRGVLFRGLRIRAPFWLGAILTSALFAIAHGQWNVAIDTFALSLLLCFLVERSNSIWPAILLHMLKNGLAFVLLFIVK